MTRPYNFAPGPAAIPTEVLQTAAAEMLDWHGSGMGVIIDAVALDGAERTVELRRLRAFEGMIVRPGQMHGILRDTDEPLEMFAFGAAN